MVDHGSTTTAFRHLYKTVHRLQVVAPQFLHMPTPEQFARNRARVYDKYHISNCVGNFKQYVSLFLKIILVRGALLNN